MVRIKNRIHAFVSSQKDSQCHRYAFSQSERIKILFQENETRKAGVTLLLTKEPSRPNYSEKDEEGHFVLMTRTVHPENITSMGQS